MFQSFSYNLMQTNKQKMLNADAQWIEDLRKDWTPFAITVVFKSSGVRPRQVHWLDEYKHKVVWKVNKQLYRHARELITVHEFFCYYEFGESSLMKSFADKRCPHHVHATLLIPSRITNRIWDEVNGILKPRLTKDFKSIRTVSSVLMEPLRGSEAINWLVYCAKGKALNSHEAV